MTGPANFKKLPWRSEKYLEFVRSLPCCLTGRTDEPREAHHQNAKGHGGKGTKCGDERALSILWRIHNRMEAPGHSRASVFAEYGKDPEQVITATQERWYQKFGNKPWEGR